MSTSVCYFRCLLSAEYVSLLEARLSGVYKRNRKQSVWYVIYDNIVNESDDSRRYSIVFQHLWV